jgi:group I intron endonuclease
MTSGVYYILNTCNDKIYVGCSSNIDNRWKDHRSNLRGGRHEIKALQQDWKTYGEAAFEFGTLVECPTQRYGRLLHIERIFFRVYQSDVPEYGYNRRRTKWGWERPKPNDERLGQVIDQWYADHPEEIERFLSELRKEPTP